MSIERVVDEYIRLLCKRHARGKISRRKYAQHVSQLMRWGMFISLYSSELEDDNFWLGDDEVDDD